MAEHAAVAVGDALLWQRCTSSMAAGNGWSGTRRYSGNSTRIPLARPSRAASSPWLRSDPSWKPPPCTNTSTWLGSMPGASSQ